MQTEYEFTLPKGLPDGQGNVHRRGIMRLATAKDEIEAMTHPKAKQAAEYVSVILLSKVVTSLGELTNLTPELIESLYSSDVNFLQNMYETINHGDDAMIRVHCPHCGKEFNEPLNFSQME